MQCIVTRSTQPELSSLLETLGLQIEGMPALATGESLPVMFDFVVGSETIRRLHR